MCRYRYYYFAACRHQELVLFDFCADAQCLQKVDCSSYTPAAARERVSARVNVREGGFTEENSDDLPFVCSTTLTQTSHSAGSSFDTGSTSITAESSYYSSSLHPADHLSHSSSTSTAPSHDMAALPLFGGTFRHWMGSTTATAPKQSNIDSRGHVFVSSKRSVDAVSLVAAGCKLLNADTLLLQLQDLGSGPSTLPARHRQPGIRENTDESCDLPKR